MLRLSRAFVLMFVLFSISLQAADAAAPIKIDRDFVSEQSIDGFAQNAQFKARDLYDHATFLTSDATNGRLAGSAGQAVARKYIESKLLDYGFDEVRRFPFEFTGDVKLGEGNKLFFQHPPGTPAENYEVLTDFRPFPISKNGEGRGELVFAGFGISAPDKGYDDYAGLDVKDKIVVIFRGEPETPENKRIGQDTADPHAAANVYGDMFYKVGIARGKGALALLVIDGERGKTPDKKLPVDLIRGGGRQHAGLPLIQIVTEVADKWFATRATGPKSCAEAKLAINEKLVPASFRFENLVPISFQSDISRERATDWNLAVVLPGQDPVLKNEIVVIGAHYDHLGLGNEFSLADKSEMGKIHRGADDNASGVASVLEIAKVLGANKQSLKRTVWIMFFGAEEMGTLGSNAFVKTPPDDFKITQNVAMLNLDMVGRCKENQLLVQGIGTGTGFEAIVKSANEGIGLEIKSKADGFGPSDHAVFVAQGIPVLFFNTNSHEDYHKPSDTVDKLNVDKQARITGLVTRIAASLINAPERSKYVKLDGPKMAGGMGGIRLGLLPDYGFEGKGLRLSGVRGASPADKAGMKTGDIITEFGATRVENIYDYMNALKQAKINLPNPVTLLRDGKELELKVVPERAE